ncbi:MAG: diadenylate cyclase [Hadesarchaea archaeon]|nr:diadenylate cyclase [Hadesarchaea archaeon]
MNIQKKLTSMAVKLAQEIDADGILVLTESGKSYKLLAENSGGFEITAASPNEDTAEEIKNEFDSNIIRLLVRDRTRMDQIRHAVWRGLREDFFSPGDLLVCVTGESGFSGGTDTISVYSVSESEQTLAEIVESDLVVNSVVRIATELAHSGGKGGPIGGAFIIGDSEKVLNLSHQLGVNPYKGHDSLSILDRKNWEIVKKFAYLDGAFIVNKEGFLIAAGRYLDADAKVDIPKGLGTRHIAVASITAATHSKGVTVSGEDGTIRIFEDGEILAKVDPDSRMLREFLSG